MLRRISSVVAFLLVSFLGCTVDRNPPTAPIPSERGGVPVETPGATVVLPAGSVDGMAAAVAAAGPHGKVIVASGMHTESGRVLITSPVRISGQPGAVIEFGTLAITDFSQDLIADFHVKNTRNVTIEGLDLRAPTGQVAGTAVLIEGSRHVRIANNVISGHQYAAYLIHADHARVERNTADIPAGWQTGELIDAQGIIVVSGAKVHVVDNTITNGLFGIWCCDKSGLASGNRTSGCLVGLILCTVPAGSAVVDGVAYGADFSCSEWLVKDNDGSNNLTAGLLVVDNANNNRLVNNTGSGNGTYDIEFAGDSLRFGFLTPSSWNNHAVLGNQPSLRVKDCGVNNTLLGTVDLVDNNADPCF